MKLYDLMGNQVNNPPIKVFRGLDVYKNKTDGITQIETILKNGHVPSHALLIQQGKFDFERMWQHASPWTFNKQRTEKYVEMVQKNH